MLVTFHFTTTRPEHGLWCYRPTFTLKNGQIAAGEDCAGEFHLYFLIPALNELGQALFGLIKMLADIKFIEINDEPDEFLSIAPWHRRQV